MKFRLGAAQVTLLDTGDLRADIREWLGLTAEQLTLRPEFAQPTRVPVQDVHIGLGDASVLVDASRWEYSDDADYGIPGYTPPPDLATQLMQAGIDRNQITHVVLTHIHFDHVNGLLHDGELLCPNAMHYIGAGERPRYERDHTKTLAEVEWRGRLRWVSEPTEIAEGIDILPAPGETPGHQIVRVRSQGQSLYCMADVYHHECEIVQDDWHPALADRVANRATRAWLTEAALREQALLIGTHLHGVGRLVRTNTGLQWHHAVGL